jgi:hypothetical protein
MDGKLMSHLSLGVLKEIDGATNLCSRDASFFGRDIKQIA